MEIYQGVKFRSQQRATTFSYDQRLISLNHWAYIFSQLGLAPNHATGTFGNFSYRIEPGSFVISKTGMTPTAELVAQNYCHIVDSNSNSGEYIFDGCDPPSSECSLHYLLYQKRSDCNAIMHGHCSLLNEQAMSLGIPQTSQFHPYGTPELAQSAIELVNSQTDFFILKDHGFVALGEDIKSCGRLTLDYYEKLVRMLAG